MSEQDFRPGLVKKSRYEREAGINLRHVIFRKHRELEQAGAICRYGRHWMVDPERLEDFIRDGGCTEIAR